MRGAFDSRPNEYNLTTNPCHLFASFLFLDISGIHLYGGTPFLLGAVVASKNDEGKGWRPQKFGGPKAIGNGILKKRRSTAKFRPTPPATRIGSGGRYGGVGGGSSGNYRVP